MLRHVFLLAVLVLPTGQAFALERTVTSSNAAQRFEQASTNSLIDVLTEHVETLETRVIELENNTIWTENFSCPDGKAVTGFTDGAPVCTEFGSTPQDCTGSNPSGCNYALCGGWDQAATYSCIDGSWTFTGCTYSGGCGDPAGTN